MGKNKGKGASNLRRINTKKKNDRMLDNLHKKLMDSGSPSITFDIDKCFVYKCDDKTN